MDTHRQHHRDPTTGRSRAVTAATAVSLVLALAGCGGGGGGAGGGGGGGGGSAPTHTGAPTPSPASSRLSTATTADRDQLAEYTEPADAYASVYHLIAGAQRSIDLTMYELADPQAEGLLIAAHRRGVAVRVLLDRADHGGSVNQTAYARLMAAGVAVRWAATGVIFHQKTLTVDGDRSAVLTGNLTARYYPTTRDFVVVDRDPAAVTAIESVFTDDWNADPVTSVPAVAGLVWSPGASPALIGLIGSARRSLTVENEEMDSTVIEAALAAAAHRGVDVELIMTADRSWDGALASLAGAGVHVVTHPDSASALYIHAKAIVADGTTAYLGSQNFSASSLDHNRELGLITTDAAVVGPVAATLAGDSAG